MTKEFKLQILSALFVAGLIATNLLGSKVTELNFGALWGSPYSLAFSVGIFAYPITFLMSDAIAEVYGKKKAQQLVWATLLAQLVVLALTIISIKMPSAGRYDYGEEYTTVFSGSARMITASIIAFFFSQTHDIWAFEFWKKKTKGKMLWLRNNLSTMVSQAIDTLLFMFIAFYGISDKFTVGFILHLAVSYWLLKIIIALIDTPFVYAIVRWLRSEPKKAS